MRILALVFALGVIAWVMLQAAGGPEADSVISQGHQDALQKAQDVEAAIADSVENKLNKLEEQQ